MWLDPCKLFKTLNLDKSQTAELVFIIIVNWLLHTHPVFSIYQTVYSAVFQWMNENVNQVAKKVSPFSYDLHTCQSATNV